MDTLIFDALMDTKTKELLAIYEDKMSKTKKKLTVSTDELDFNSKKLIRQINATIDKKLKNSAAYKKKCEEELASTASYPP
uniref:Uncharacterized protein n=1 Tax=viral metagenome TaxID=1070528 RepID=A0A6C0LFC7_9ZZZZ